ncbi:MAG: radical SAM protein [Deltaproteobacteria bacterium]|nr:radical SAM protein [Deltaproteobacteria bacterium]
MIRSFFRPPEIPAPVERTPVVLLGGHPGSHDARALAAGLPPWREVMGALASGADGVRLPVTRDTFWDLHRIAATAAYLVGAGRKAPALPPFVPNPLPDAPAALEGWLGELRGALEGFAVQIDAPSDELMALLATVAGAADPLNRGILLRLLGALTGGVFRGPATVHVDVANACNVNCIYCWFHSPLSADREDAAEFDTAWRSEMLDWATFEKLIDDLDGLDAREDVLLSGKGEPLLHPQCLDMVRAVKARDLGCTLFSNGVLVREEARRAVVEAGLDLLYVSLSSASPEVYEAIHPDHDGVAELEEVRANVRALTQLKANRGTPTPRVMMVDVVNSLNAHEVLDFYEQARDLGAEHVRYQLQHVQPYNAQLRIRPDQVEQLRLDIAEAHRREAEGGPSIVPNIDWQLATLEVSSGVWGHGRTPDEGCYVGWTFSRTWTNGDVSFCCSPKVVDSLHERSFSEIWQGERYAKFRNAARDLATHGDMTFSNGAKLLGDHCVGCPNYEGIGKLAEDLRRYGLEQFVRGRDRQRLRDASPDS